MIQQRKVRYLKEAVDSVFQTVVILQKQVIPGDHRKCLPPGIYYAVAARALVRFCTIQGRYSLSEFLDWTLFYTRLFEQCVFIAESSFSICSLLALYVCQLTISHNLS